MQVTGRLTPTPQVGYYGVVVSTDEQHYLAVEMVKVRNNTKSKSVIVEKGLGASIKDAGEIGQTCSGQSKCILNEPARIKAT